MTGPIARLLSQLSEAGTRYLVVGGVAVVLHGYLRATADLDLVIELEPENLQKALELFEREGFHPRPPVPLRSFADPAERHRWKEEKNLQVFSLWHGNTPGFEVDIFVEEPFPFDAAFQRCMTATIGGISIQVASIEDLISMKRAAGRPKDMEDIDALLALRKIDEQR